MMCSMNYLRRDRLQSFPEQHGEAKVGEAARLPSKLGSEWGLSSAGRQAKKSTTK